MLMRAIRKDYAQLSKISINRLATKRIKSTTSNNLLRASKMLSRLRVSKRSTTSTIWRAKLKSLKMYRLSLRLR
jgi:hypothetical protein